MLNSSTKSSRPTMWRECLECDNQRSIICLRSRRACSGTCIPLSGCTSSNSATALPSMCPTINVLHQVAASREMAGNLRPGQVGATSSDRKPRPRRRPHLADSCRSRRAGAVVTSNANGWSSRMKTGGQVGCKRLVKSVAISHPILDLLEKSPRPLL